MRGRPPAAVATLAAVAACAVLVTGCGGSDDSSGAAAPAATTATATTTAPATVPSTVDPTVTAPAGPGSVAAGKVVFAGSCDTCHAGLGSRKYIGPRLAGQGLGAALIRELVVQGKSPMPAGLVSGQDLADVVAFVRSIQ